MTDQLPVSEADLATFVEPTVADRLMGENDFQEWLRDLAGTTGWLYYHTHRSQFSASGFPDTVLAKPPREVIYAELKTEDLENSQPSIDQWIWLYTLQHCAGTQAYLWRPSDRNYIEHLLTNDRLPYIPAFSSESI